MAYLDLSYNPGLNFKKDDYKFFKHCENQYGNTIFKYFQLFLSLLLTFWPKIQFIQETMFVLVLKTTRSKEITKPLWQTCTYKTQRFVRKCSITAGCLYST